MALSLHSDRVFQLNYQVLAHESRACLKCKQLGHFWNQCGRSKYSDLKIDSSSADFDLYSLREVRQYLDLEFRYIKFRFKRYEAARIVDDFIFLCLLTGAAGTPPLQFLPIQKGGLDCIFFVYKRQIPLFADYLTNRNKLNLPVINQLFRILGGAESSLFESQVRKQFLAMNRNFKQQSDWSQFIAHLKSEVHNETQEEEQEAMDTETVVPDESKPSVSPIDRVQQIFDANQKELGMTAIVTEPKPGTQPENKEKTSKPQERSAVATSE